MFPLGFEGSIELASAKESQFDGILSRIQAALASVSARNIDRDGNKVSFKTGMFRFVSSINILGPVSSGEIELIAGRPCAARYQFSCLPLFVGPAAFAFLAAYADWALAGKKLEAVWAGLFGGACLFGAQYLISWFRLDRFVRRLVSEEA
jgi:hypothetical protein